RRAVQVRDRECFHPTCEEDAEHRQVDHVIPWNAGGPTIEANGRLACGTHNRQRHARPPP
ncbi:MAG TPA: HNH endonuclease signature motif containing protein, partial [Acidimicrobiales bacterium]|nr:HNH endonuclease signature motif containing protein [Acidimicrobiales bacterium]